MKEFISKIKNNKKIVIISISSLLVLIVLSFIIRNINLSRLKGSIAPVNENFDDINFYACVVNAYNEENGTNYGILTNLTDEQLSSIKNVSCWDYTNTYNNTYNLNNPNYHTVNILMKNNAKISDTFNLPYFELSNNYSDINSISGVEKLTNLESFSIYSKSTYEDGLNLINKIKNNNKLKKLEFNSPIENLNLDDIPNIEELNYYISNSTMHITGSSNKLKKLKGYQLTDNTYENPINIEPGANIPNIEELYYVRVEDFSTIKDLTHVKELYLMALDNTFANTSLSEFASLENLETLVLDNADFNAVNNLPVLPNLKEFSMFNVHYKNFSYRRNYTTVLSVDFEKFPNLEYLNLNNFNATDYNSGEIVLTKITDLTNITSLNYLKSISITDLLNNNSNNLILGDLNVFPNLKTLGVSHFTANVPLYNIENLFGGNSTTFNNLPNLKRYVDSDTWVEHDLDDYISMQNIEEYYSDRCDILTHIPDLSNIKKLYCYHVNNDSSLLTQSALSRMTNLEYVYADGDNYYDFSSNKKLKGIFSIGTGIENLTDLEYIFALAELNTTGDSNTQYLTNPDTDLSKLKKLKKLVIYRLTGDVDFSNNPNLEDVAVYYSTTPYAEINLSNNSKLKTLYANSLNVTFPEDDNVEFAYMPENSNRFDKFGYKDTTYSSNVLLGLPKRLKIVNLNAQDGNISITDNQITLNDTGNSSASMKLILDNAKAYTTINSDSVVTYEYNANVDIAIMDINSKTVTINKEKKYILTNGLNSEKEIIKDISINPKISNNGSPIYKFIDKNYFVIASDKKALDKFKIIKVLSNKYFVDDDKIIFYSTFDKDNIRVINADYEINGNKLNIKNNGNIIKTYTLTRDNLKVGDVNNDGEISITDLVKQYKHVKYMLDLEGKEFIRADLNDDDDVSISDVKALYDYIKDGDKYE